MKRILLFLFISVFIALPCCRKAPAAIPQGEWNYDIMLNDTVIGSATRTESIEGVNFKSELTMEMGVGTIRNSVKQVVIETINCEPVSLEITSSMINGKDRQVSRKKVSFNGREIRGEDDGRAFSATIDRPFYLDEGKYFIREMIRKKFRTGSQVEAWMYDPMEELDKPVLFRMRVRGTDTITIGDASVKVYVLEEVAHYKNVLWYVDEEGVLQKIVISMLNTRMEMVRRSGSIKSGAENSRLKIDAFIVHPSNVTPALYAAQVTRYELKSADVEFSLPQTASQFIIEKKVSSDGVSIVVESGTAGDTVAPSGGMYLEATRYLDYDSPVLAAKKESFTASADPIRDIERFVNDHIKDKLIGIPLIPASNVFQGRAGDCTEHAVLSIALLRASGIPARAVVGMILTENFEGNRDVFVYHMWAEAWRNGKWDIVDATRPGAVHPNRYIALAYHTLKTEMPADYLKAISSVQNMAVSVIR